ncbi:MAG: DUF4126 domain-containing protein [Moraxella sp.]|nr:DUF4126 domain-containing protein [Moraxella sp.]
MTIEIMISICLGVGLAASSGFRVFVPLFVVSVAAFFGVLPLSENWLWLGSTAALVILAVASLVESVSYLVPIVDNALDAIAVPLAGLAGTIVMASSLTELSPAMAWALAIVAGGGAATAVKTTAAATRAVSTITTAGVANPVVSVAETGTSLVLSILAVFAPVAAAVVAVLLAMMLLWLLFKFKRSAKR